MCSLCFHKFLTIYFIILNCFLSCSLFLRFLFPFNFFIELFQLTSIGLQLLLIHSFSTIPTFIFYFLREYSFILRLSTFIDYFPVSLSNTFHFLKSRITPFPFSSFIPFFHFLNQSFLSPLSPSNKDKTDTHTNVLKYNIRTVSEHTPTPTPTPTSGFGKPASYQNILWLQLFLQDSAFYNVSAEMSIPKYYLFNVFFSQVFL